MALTVIGFIGATPAVRLKSFYGFSVRTENLALQQAKCIRIGPKTAASGVLSPAFIIKNAIIIPGR